MCNTNWQTNLESGSISLSDIRSHINKLRPEDQDILNRIMESIVRECPNLELLPALGFKPFSFHIKLPDSSKPYVWAAVHPQVRNGIRVMSRRQLRNYQINADSQLRWQNQITNDDDIDIVINYLRGL